MSVISGSAERTIAYCGGLSRRLEYVAGASRAGCSRSSVGISERSTGRRGRLRRRMRTRRAHNCPARASGLQGAANYCRRCHLPAETSSSGWPFNRSTTPQPQAPATGWLQPDMTGVAHLGWQAAAPADRCRLKGAQRHRPCSSGEAEASLALPGTAAPTARVGPSPWPAAPSPAGLAAYAGQQPGTPIRWRSQSVHLARAVPQVR